MAVAVDVSGTERPEAGLPVRVGETEMRISSLGPRCKCNPPKSYNLLLTHVDGPARDLQIGDTLTLGVGQA